MDRTTTYREAVRAALREALLEDPRVFLMGEDVGKYGGSYAVSKGLLDEFGPDRIRDTPLSESTFVGAGIGAALAGMRPIVEVMTVNFSLLALDQIVNNAATIRHMSGGQFSIPLVIRMATGAGRQLAAQHAHSLEGWFAHIPGLRIVTPATLEDARGMLWTALQDPLFRKYVQTREHRGKAVRPDGTTREAVWRNTNQLLNIEGYDGVKTGTTGAAGACLVCSGRRGSDHLLVVVLGSTSADARYVDARNLIRWAWLQRGHKP